MEGTNCLLAIFCIAVIALATISQNGDSTFLGLCVAAIAGLGGYEVYRKVKEQDVVV